MEPFVRPDIDLTVFRDTDGAVIDHGRRWWPTGDEGPDHTYSVTLHPGRFARLVTPARALIAHLELTSFALVRCAAGIDSDIAWFCPCDHCDEDVVVAAWSTASAGVARGRRRRAPRAPQPGRAGR